MMNLQKLPARRFPSSRRPATCLRPATIRRLRTGLGALAAGLWLLVGTGALAQTTRDVNRSMEIWYGTLTVVGAPAADVDVIQLTDFICPAVETSILSDGLVDLRVKNGIGPWTNEQTSIEWVYGTPDGFPAAQNLFDAYVTLDAQLDAQFGPGDLVLLPSVMHGTQTYDLGSFQTWEEGGVLVEDNMSADVTYFERNAVWERNAVRAIPLPPAIWSGAGMLIALGCIRSLRRNQKGRESLLTD